MFWETQRLPNKQTDWQARRRGQHTVVTKESSTSHGHEDSLCRMSNPSQFDYTHHAQIYVAHKDSCSCYFGKGRCLGLSLTIQLSPALSCTFSISLTRSNTRIHLSPFLFLSLPTALATLPHSVFHGLSFQSALRTK